MVVYCFKKNDKLRTKAKRKLEKIQAINSLFSYINQLFKELPLLFRETSNEDELPNKHICYR